MESLVNLTEDRLIELIPDALLQSLVKRYKETKKYPIVYNVRLIHLDIFLKHKYRYNGTEGAYGSREEIIDNYIDFLVDLIETISGSLQVKDILAIPKYKHSTKDIYIDERGLYVADTQMRYDLHSYNAFPLISDSQIVIELANKYGLLDEIGLIHASVGDSFMYHENIGDPFPISTLHNMDIEKCRAWPFRNAICFKVDY